ncbi:MAG TPA: hypothetical protein PLL15_07240, partial [Syntrophales bacterium]|nr:hypothetical protein [Syntrophales bacterium]
GHEAYNGSQIFGAKMAYDGGTGGAFVGALTGIIRDTDATEAASENPLDGLIIGLYAAPDGKAGVLKGNFTGTSYTGINMWETADTAGAATLYRDAAFVALGKLSYFDTPSELLDPSNLFQGVIGAGIDSAIHGTFGGSGSIASPMGIMGQTLSLSAQPCWGIFTLQIGMDNTYANPTATDWSATLFGSGVFGKYPAGYGPYGDWGYWYANLGSGTWTGGKMTGTLGGSGFFTDSAFVTHMKVGTLEGSLLGTYDASGTSWQATAAGSYNKTQDVLFSSEIWGRSYKLVEETQGSVAYANGNVYNYWYTPSEGHGDSSYYNPTTRTETITRMGIEGPPGAEMGRKEVWVRTQGPGADTIWDTPDDTYTYTFKTETYDSPDDLTALGVYPVVPTGGDIVDGPMPQLTFWDSDFNGIFAGVENLWDNAGIVTPTIANPYTSAPTQVYLMGDVDTFDGNPLSLFSGEVVSFNPMYDLNPFYDVPSVTGGSQTPIGGAYYGFLGGIADGVTNNLSAFFRGLYLDEDGQLGILFTGADLSGSYDPHVGMWKAEGDVYTYALNAVSPKNPGIFPINFAANLGQWEDRMSFEPVDAQNLENATETTVTGIDIGANAGSGIGLPVLVGGNPSYLTLNSSVVGGGFTYDDEPVVPPVSWTWALGSPMDGVTLIGVNDAEGTGNNTFKSTLVSADINWANAQTSISGGQIKGIFDPAKATWQAVISELGMETSGLLNTLGLLTTDEQRAAFYKATNIPSFQVGSTDLRGTWSDEAGATIDMAKNIGPGQYYGISNATFFAPSTGAKPQVWASGNVSGAFTGNPSSATFGLTGYQPGTVATNSIEAQFNMQNWNAGAPQPTWGATVTNGNVPTNSLTGASGYTASNPVGFQGGAAGAINTDLGTFMGTAAGIVTPPPPGE